MVEKGKVEFMLIQFNFKNFKSFREEALLMAFDPYTIMFRLYYKAWAFVMHI